MYNILFSVVMHLNQTENGYPSADSAKKLKFKNSFNLCLCIEEPLKIKNPEIKAASFSNYHLEVVNSVPMISVKSLKEVVMPKNAEFRKLNEPKMRKKALFSKNIYFFKFSKFVLLGTA